MDDTKITERIALFTKPYQNFLSGNFVDEVTTALGRVEQLNEDQMIIFKNTVSLFLLCFLDTAEAIDFLSEEADLDVSLARPLFGAVLSAMPQEVQAAQSEAFTAINGVDVAAISVSEQIFSQPEIPLSTQNNPYPTQETDGTNVYQTSQDAVLNPPLQNPNPPTNDATRWGQV